MTPFWVLQKDKAAASAVVSGKELILENRYLRRVIDTETGRTVSIKDGDGEEAISASCREGSFSADGIFHELSGPCRIRIMDGNLTEKKFDYAPRPYNTHPFPYPAPGKTAELFYDFGRVDDDSLPGVVFDVEGFADQGHVVEDLIDQPRLEGAEVIEKLRRLSGGGIGEGMRVVGPRGVGELLFRQIPGRDGEPARTL